MSYMKVIFKNSEIYITSDEFKANTLINKLNKNDKDSAKYYIEDTEFDKIKRALLNKTFYRCRVNGHITILPYEVIKDCVISFVWSAEKGETV